MCLFLPPQLFLSRKHIPLRSFSFLLSAMANSGSDTPTRRDARRSGRGRQLHDVDVDNDSRYEGGDSHYDLRHDETQHDASSGHHPQPNSLTRPHTPPRRSHDLEHTPYDHTSQRHAHSPHHEHHHRRYTGRESKDPRHEELLNAHPIIKDTCRNVRPLSTVSRWLIGTAKPSTQLNRRTGAPGCWFVHPDGYAEQGGTVMSLPSAMVEGEDIQQDSSRKTIHSAARWKVTRLEL